MAAAWGLVGVAALLASAVLRLAPVAFDALRASLTLPQWLLAAGAVGFMGFFEGYRGFQQGFAPRVVVRALHLARKPRAGLALVAPLYCMGLVHASRRRLIASWSLTAGIVGLVLLVRQLPQPYRGIIDAGVVVGLTWGVVALAAFAIRAAAGSPPDVCPDLPLRQKQA